MIGIRRTEAHAPPQQDWPSMSEEPAPSAFSVELEKDGPDLRIVRRLACGGTTVARTIVWSVSIKDAPTCDEAHDALSGPDCDLALCSVNALGLGHERATQWVAAVVMRHSEERKEARENTAVARLEQEEKARRESEEAEDENELVVYFREKDEDYHLVIERNHCGAPELWSIAFDEEWERDRFWDWFRWQDPKYEGIVASDPDVSKVELERILLNEMLDVEQAVKKQKRGAGGRRPLRFWRGAK